MKRIILLVLVVMMMTLVACSEQEEKQYFCLIDENTLYKAIEASETTYKIERWKRSDEKKDEDPFKYASDMCIIDTADSAVDFEWLNEEHSAFSVDVDGCLGAETFKKATSNKYRTEYSYMHDKWHLYKTVWETESTYKVECWQRLDSSENGDSFEYKYDVCVVNKNNTNGFTWVDDEHSAFVVNMEDPDNGNWEGTKAAVFSQATGEEHTSEFIYLHDKWNMYKFVRLSDSAFKIENWGRLDASENGEPFKHEYDVCVINYKDGSSDFKWVEDSNFNAFTITMQDKENSYWEELEKVVATRTGGKVFSCEYDTWNLYKAVQLSDSVFKIENWGREGGSSSGKFKHEYDVCVINMSDNSTEFQWTDDLHGGFTAIIDDKKNWSGDSKRNLTFEIELENCS